MNKQDLIVLIPYFNDKSGLIASLKSIKESFSFDLMIIDDGSKVPIDKEEISKIFINGKVFLHRLNENKGIEHALNFGLKEIIKLSYKFIARLDVGDTCIPGRFAIQLAYLINHPETKLLGSQVSFMNEDCKTLYKSNLPLSYPALKKWFYVNCKIIHPTVMFKTEIIEKVGYYPTNYKAAEDYAFFFKILKFYKAENLKECLVHVLINPKGISVNQRKHQLISKIAIIKDNYYPGLIPTYGILRNFILLMLPYKLVQYIKQNIK